MTKCLFTKKKSRNIIISEYLIYELKQQNLIESYNIFDLTEISKSGENMIVLHFKQCCLKDIKYETQQFQFEIISTLEQNFLSFTGKNLIINENTAIKKSCPHKHCEFNSIYKAGAIYNDYEVIKSQSTKILNKLAADPDKKLNPENRIPLKHN